MDLENVICIIIKNLVNVAMRSDAWFYIIFMYLYNKNVLKYAQILVISGRFMIFHIEGHSNNYEIFENFGTMLVSMMCRLLPANKKQDLTQSSLFAQLTQLGTDHSVV